MYDRTRSAEVLGDLHDELRLKFGKKPTFKKLSNDIEEVTGVEISSTSLWEYEDTGKEKNMSIKNLVALAEYYDVSYDYLLGKSESRKSENIEINRKYGLTDGALSRIENMKDMKTRGYEIKYIDAFNAFVESDSFKDIMEELVKCPNAYDIRENGLSQNERLKREILATITDEQKSLIEEGKLLIFEPKNYLDTILSSLQLSIVEAAIEISEKKTKRP